MSDDKMRQAFEVWAWENGDSHFPDFSKDESDDRTYWGRVTELAWRAWQAAQRQGGEAVASSGIKEVLDAALRVAYDRGGDGNDEDGIYATTSVDRMIELEDSLCRAFDCTSDDVVFDEIAPKIAALYTAPQPQPAVPESDWIACSERLPTVADADCNYHVWAHDRAFTRPEYSQCLFVWSAVRDVADITHWKPTGLKRPEPPEET